MFEPQILFNGESLIVWLLASFQSGRTSKSINHWDRKTAPFSCMCQSIRQRTIFTETIECVTFGPYYGTVVPYVPYVCLIDKIQKNLVGAFLRMTDHPLLLARRLVSHVVSFVGCFTKNIKAWKSSLFGVVVVLYKKSSSVVVMIVAFPLSVHSCICIGAQSKECTCDFASC